MGPPHTWTREQHDDEQLSLRLTQLDRDDGFQAVIDNHKDDLPVSNHGDVPVAILNRIRNFPRRRP